MPSQPSIFYSIFYSNFHHAKVKRRMRSADCEAPYARRKIEKFETNMDLSASSKTQ